MAKNSDVRARFFFRGKKTAAQFKLNTKKGKEIPGDNLAVHMNRFSVSRDAEFFAAVTNQVFEDAISGTEIEKVGIGQIIRVWSAAGNPGSEGYETIRFRIGKRAEDYGVNNGKYGRVCSDAQG